MHDSTSPRALLWAYDEGAPSFRHRCAAAVPHAEERGWRCEVERLPRGRYLRRVLERRAALARCDLLVLSKIKLSAGEWGLVRRFARRVVFDFDDAVYVRRPRRLGEAPDSSWWRRFKFARTCRMADLVVAGNETLAGQARPHARRVEVVPTPVDAAAYPDAPPAERGGRTIVWIGRPENLVYLELVRPVLAALARRFEGLRLRIVCSHFPDWDDVPLERVPWSADGEARALATADIGIMPLSDDAWSRGKCAFKLLQCMAAGLPCVASPVGASSTAVLDGRTGILAATPDQWHAALSRLLEDAGVRAAQGAAGRRRVLEHYDRRVLAPRWVELFESLR